MERINQLYRAFPVTAPSVSPAVCSRHLIQKEKVPVPRPHPDTSFLLLHSPTTMDTINPPADNGQEWILRLVSTAGKRLFWRLNGPLEHAITVAPSEYYEPDAVMEPYFIPASDDLDAAPLWHAVSQESLLTPPVSSITVRIQCIDNWERVWADQHRECWDAIHDSDRRRLGPRPGDETLDAPMYVLECCLQERPWSRDTKLEVASAGAFVTIHEYVSAVHPWLMGMRNTLLDVLGKTVCQPPWPAETKLAVLYLGPGPLRIGHEDRWAYWHKRPPGPGNLVAYPSGEERARQVEERAPKVIERAKARTAAMVRAQEEAALQGLDEPAMVRAL